jgi:peptide/nickel transport system substrate-binding protein
LLTVIALVAAACGTTDQATTAIGETPETGAAGATSPAGAGPTGTLRVVRTESFDGWVLDSAAAYGSYQTHAAVIEGLLRPAADGQSVEPGLAESWTHDPELATWTFRIRDNARFSNGEPVTADDVVFSFGVWSSGPNFGALYGNVVGATATDEKTVVFELASSVDNGFLALISASISGVMPADFAGISEDEYYANPIGAGAFRVEDWSIGGRIVLRANEFFYGYPNRPGFEEVVIDVVADDTERAILFDAGDADLVEYVSASTASQYDDAEIRALLPSQIEHLSLNVLAPLFDDVDVRNAVARAIDYAAIVDGPFAGFATLPTGILAPNLAGWAPPSEPYYTTDVAAARTLLAGSSAPDGASVELIYDSGLAGDTLVAQIIKSNLAEIGLDVQLTGLETGAFLDRAFSLDADMMLWSYGAISPDITDPIGWFLGTGWLFTGWDTDTLGEQFSASSVAATDLDRAAVATEIQDQAFRNAQAIALAEFQVIHAVSPGLSGFESAPWGVYFYDTISAGR